MEEKNLIFENVNLMEKTVEKLDLSHLETKATKLNNNAFSFAQRLIRANKYIIPNSWNPPSAEAENRYIEENGIEKFALWHLAFESEANPDTKGAYKYIYTSDFENVDRRGLIAIRQRAGQQGQDDVFEAAGKLLEMIDEKEKASKIAFYKNFESSIEVKQTSPVLKLDFVISTSELDRDFEIVVPKGILYENYMKNPIVLFNHDVSKPIGTCEKIEVHEDAIIAKTVIDKEKLLDPYLKTIANLIENKTIRGASIGFIPKEYHFEKKTIDGQEISVRVFDKWELVEYSIVSVPSNPSALAKVGRPISRENLQRIARARELISEAVSILHELESLVSQTNEVEQPTELNLQNQQTKEILATNNEMKVISFVEFLNLMKGGVK